MRSSFQIVIDGHGDIVGRRVLDCSETAFFSYAALCRATRGAVPRKVIDESLPGHLDAALRREDEPAVRRLAGEAMRRVGRNVHLRVALHNGGFPGLHGNAAFEPLRRELVEGLEPF